MKIEPRKTASLPKYAMLLAASAALLTGCDFNRPVAEDGTAPDSDVRIDGEMEEYTSPVSTAPTTEPMLEGEINPYEIDADDMNRTETVTTAQNCTPDIAGVIDARTGDEADPVGLEGDVAVITPVDDTHATDYDLMQRRRDLQLLYQPCFEAEGIRMEQGSPILTDCWFDMQFSPALADQENNVQVVFYDGSLTKEGVPLHTWLCDRCTAAYDWGGVLEQEDASGGICKVLFIDMSRKVEDCAADTAQIVKDAGL